MAASICWDDQRRRCSPDSLGPRQSHTNTGVRSHNITRDVSVNKWNSLLYYNNLLKDDSVTFLQCSFHLRVYKWWKFFLLERFNRSCVNVIDVKVKKPLKTSYFMHYFPMKPRGSITCLQKPFQVSSRYFLSHPQCSPHKTVTSWATSWGATAWSGGRKDCSGWDDEGQQNIKANETENLQMKHQGMTLSQKMEMQRGRAAWSHLNSDW